MFIDPLYLLFLAPPMLLSAWAAWAMRSRFARWSQVPNRAALSGVVVARTLLDQNGLEHIGVVPVRGALSDHYDPRARVVRLSEPVDGSASVSAMAVAAHECGHAIQDARRYAPFALRSISVPLATLGSNLGVLIVSVGFVLSVTELVWVGIFLFSGTVFFQLVTLPVELDASKRGEQELARLGMVDASEAAGVRSVLTAAAMTYVGAAISSIATLAYFVLRASTGRRRR
jgi:uncharacterized protein